MDETESAAVDNNLVQAKGIQRDFSAELQPAQELFSSCLSC